MQVYNMNKLAKLWGGASKATFGEQELVTNYTSIL